MRRMPNLLSALAAACLAGTLGANAQGSFQNLGFESANVPNLPPGQGAVVLASDAIPGWTAYGGPNQLQNILYNDLSGGGVTISVIGHNTATWSNNVIAGNYTAALSAGEGTFGFVSAAVAQSSLVPVAAQSLRFRALPLIGNISDLIVTLNGQPIPFFALSTGANYVNYGADISSFAGQTEELRFTEWPNSNPFATIFLDSIQFSNLPVPEPGVFGLSAIGALLLGWRIRGRRQ